MENKMGKEKLYIDADKKPLREGFYLDNVGNACFITDTKIEWHLDGGRSVDSSKFKHYNQIEDVESYLAFAKSNIKFITSKLEELARPEKPENIGGCGKMGIRGISLREVGRFERSE